MKQVSEMPTSGRFVAVWVYNNKIWSSVYKCESGCLNLYSPVDVDYEPIYDVDDFKQRLDSVNAQYFIAE